MSFLEIYSVEFKSLISFTSSFVLEFFDSFLFLRAIS